MTMDVLTQLKIRQTPQEWFCVPEPLMMIPSDADTLPALVSELVNMSIESVAPKTKVGRVLLFDVTPYRRFDPPLLYCQVVNMSEYYYMWNTVIHRNIDSNTLYKYDEMVKSLNISNLNEYEASFLFMNLLDFKNRYVRRR